MVASAQYIAHILDCFRQATEANLVTPGRQGNIVSVMTELADEVMITGDLHGNRHNFNALRRIAALEEYPRRHLVLQEVCHGGPLYPNGGCMSHTLLEDIAALKVKFPNQVHFILGNHELAEMTDYPIQKSKQMLNMQFRLGLQHVYREKSEEVREAYVAFLQSCPLAVQLPQGEFISHSIPEDCDTEPFDASIFTRELGYVEYFSHTGVFQLVWGRDYRQENADAFAELVGARILINGHEPCLNGFSTPNNRQLILDCCTDRGAYLILPTRQPISLSLMTQLVSRIEG